MTVFRYQVFSMTIGFMQLQSKIIWIVIYLDLIQTKNKSNEYTVYAQHIVVNISLFLL